MKFNKIFDIFIRSMVNPIALVALMQLNFTSCDTSLKTTVSSECTKKPNSKCKTSTNGAVEFSTEKSIATNDPSAEVTWDKDPEASEYYASTDNKEPLATLKGRSEASYKPNEDLEEGVHVLYVWKRPSINDFWQPYVKINFTVDTQKPTIASVTSFSADSTYAAESIVDIQLSFSEIVNVASEDPALTTITLNSGGLARYKSGSGTSVLVFSYTVGSSDTATDLDVASVSALTTSTTITDNARNTAVLSLPVGSHLGSLGSGRSIVIAGNAPTVVSVSSTKVNGIYKTADVIALTVLFSETVNVVGTPTLTVEVGATDAVVNYSSGSGSSLLTFTYTVSSNQNSYDLDYQSINALALNGGTIRNSIGTNAVLTLPTNGGANSIAGQKSISIDTTPPVLSSLSITTSTPNRLSTPSVQFTLSEAAIVTLYSDSSCASTSISSGISKSSGVNTMATNALSGNATTTIYASAVDTAGNQSVCGNFGSFVTDTVAPAASSSLTPTAGDGMVSLVWNASTGSTAGYIIVRHLSSAVSFAPTAGVNYSSGSQGADDIVYVGTNLSYTDSGLTNGSTYHYSVFAKDAALNWSAAATANATPAAASQTLDSVTVTPPTTISVGSPFYVTANLLKTGGGAFAENAQVNIAVCAGASTGISCTSVSGTLSGTTSLSGTSGSFSVGPMTFSSTESIKLKVTVTSSSVFVLSAARTPMIRAWVGPSARANFVSLPGHSVSYTRTAVNSNGDAIIAFLQLDVGLKTRLFYSERVAGTWTHPTQFSDSLSPLTGDGVASVEVSYNNNRDVVFAFAQFDDSTALRLYKAERRSGVWTNPADLNDYISVAGSPVLYNDIKVKLNNSGAVIIAWAQPTTDTIRTCYSTRTSGGAWTHPTVYTNCTLVATDDNPAIKRHTMLGGMGMDDNGDVVMAIYTQRTDYAGDFRLHRMERRGGSWTVPVNWGDTIAHILTPSGSMKVFVNRLGKAVIAWTQTKTTDSNNPYLYLVEYNGTGWTSAGEGNNVSPAGLSVGLSDIAMNDAGDVIITYSYMYEYYISERIFGTWTHPAATGGANVFHNNFGNGINRSLICAKSASSTLAVWNTYGSGTTQDMYRALKTSTWAAAFPSNSTDTFSITPAPDYESTDFSIGMNESGDAVIAFNQLSGESPTRFYQMYISEFK